MRMRAAKASYASMREWDRLLEDGGSRCDAVRCAMPRNPNKSERMCATEKTTCARISARLEISAGIPWGRLLTKMLLKKLSDRYC